MEKSVLILSPSPPIPRDYGNRNRVNQIFNFFVERGFKTYFLLYPFDKDWEGSLPEYRCELEGLCTYFGVVPNTRKLHQPAENTHHALDEWWDPSIEWHIRWLSERVAFDVVLVNYIFFSKAFECVPDGTLKVLDTHDLFTGRRELFESHGLSPEFFYTDRATEQAAFARADIVISIKEEEDRIIQAMTDRQTVCIPYWNEREGEADRSRSQRAPSAGLRFDHDRPLRLGFIGAENSVNITNVRRFIATFRDYYLLYDVPVTLSVAGNVCKGLGSVPDWVTLLGHVPDVNEFYDSIDATIAPLEFSTGIKIKVGESLASGKPVLATQNGFDGFFAYHGTQDAASIADLCSAVVKVAFGEIDFGTLVSACRRAAAAARRQNQSGLEALDRAVRERMLRVVVLTDRPFWYRSCLIDEMVAQAVEFVSYVAPTVVFYTGEERAKRGVLRSNVNLQYVGPKADEALEGLLESHSVAGALVYTSSSDSDAARVFGPALARRPVRCLRMVGPAAKPFGHLTLRSADQGDVGAAAFRYLPVGMHRNGSESHRILVFRPETLSEWEEIALDYISLFAASSRSDIVEQVVPAYAEYLPAFYDTVRSNVSVKAIFLGPYVDAFAMVRQLKALAEARWLVLREDCIFPAVYGPDMCRSLADTIEHFVLDRTWPHQAPTWGDAGWGDLWRELRG